MTEGPRDLGPGDLGPVLRRRAPLAAAVALVVAGAFGVAALWETPLYTSRGSLVFNPPSLAEGPAGLALSGESPLFLEAEVEILRSPAVLEPALDLAALRAGVAPVPIAPLERIVDNFRAHTRRLDGGPPVYPRVDGLRISGDTRHVVLTADGTGASVSYEGRGIGAVPPTGLFESPEASFRLSGPFTAGDYKVNTRPADRSLQALRDRLRLRISGVPRRSLTGASAGVVTVSLSDPDPERARRAVEAVLESFLSLHLSWRADWGAVSSGFIADRLADVDEELAAAERELEAFRASNGLLGIDAAAAAVEEDLVGLEARLDRLEVERDQVSALLAAMRAGAPAEQILLGPMTAVDSRELNGRAATLAELEGLDETLALVQTPNHPERAALQARIEAARGGLASGLDAALLHLETEAEAAREEFSAALGARRELPALTTELLRREREVEVLADTYTFLLQKQQEAAIAGASTATRVQRLESPVAAPEPDSPSLKWRALLGLLLGAFAGVVAGLAAEAVDPALHDASSVERAAGVPVIGAVPHSKRFAALAPGRQVGADGAVDAAFDGLATALSLTAERGVVSVISSRPGEGKTTVVAGLAAALARAGASVAAVDLDVRKRDLAARLGVAGGPGVDAWIAGEEPPAQETGVPGLVLMRAGEASRLAIQDPRLGELLAHLADGRDWVLVDSPPLVVPGDALWLAERADLGLLVVRAGRTSAAEVRADVAALRRVGAEPAGAVLVGAVARPLSRRYAASYYGTR